MVLSETISYVTLLCLTLCFTAFALVIQDALWRIMLKITAALFWWVMAVAQFIFFGSEGVLMILSLPYAIIGLIFVFAIFRDYLSAKHDSIWGFKDD